MSNKINQLVAFLKADPNDGFTRFALAMELQKLGRIDDAVKVYQQLLSKDPDYVGVYYHLGKALEQLNRTNEALKSYITGIEVASKHNDFHAASELQQAKTDLEWND